MHHADVLIVGSGQAGVPLAARLAARGRRVVLFERAELGGTCVNYGCTPTKTMIASAEAAHRARRAHELGVRIGDVSVDLPAIVDRKELMVDSWRSSVEKRLTEAGERLRVVRAHARFVGMRELEADGGLYTAPLVIVNVGARPAAPDLPGLAGVPWLDNTRLMALREVPRHLVVLGAGYVGCELGQAFRRFGADVTIVDRGPCPLPREDPEVGEALGKAFSAEGIRLRPGSEAVWVRGAHGNVQAGLDDGSTLEGSHLLLALGRRPNTDDLGAEAGGFALDDGGVIVVDDRYATSAEGVYAVGDCAGGPQFTHASWDDHRILFDILEGDARRTRQDRVIPHAVFTDPQVARVGLSEREAKEWGVPYEAAVLPFRHIARAQETGERAGLVKVLVDPRTERLVGATVVGSQAGELVHVYAVLMQAGAPVTALVDVEMIHPTFSEGLQTAVMKLDRYALD